METVDSLKPDDKVTITIYGPSGQQLYQATGTGFHKLDAAIQDVVDQAGLDINPEDCVFEVSNDTKGVKHRYRLNAHGNLKLII